MPGITYFKRVGIGLTRLIQASVLADGVRWPVSSLDLSSLNFHHCEYDKSFKLC